MKTLEYIYISIFSGIAILLTSVAHLALLICNSINRIESKEKKDR